MPHETFEHFMQRCLHDPKNGYYSKNIRSIGAHGDFTTAPQLSEAPAKAIASWAANAMRSARTHNLIEIGPGLGTLSNQILHNLPFTLRLRTKLHLVESSPTLLKHQKNTLKNRATYFQNIHDALESCQGKAVIFSNELVDAFPVRLFQKQHHEWLEVALDHSATPPQEILIAPSTLPQSSLFSINFPNGQRIEIHESYHKWLKSWLPMWKKGELLTIDYGNTADTLYHRRPLGSLRAYLLQNRIEGPSVYQNPGLQDLTADVNFSDLIEFSKPWLRHQEPQKLSGFIRPFCSTPDSQFLLACEHFMTLRQSPW